VYKSFFKLNPFKVLLFLHMFVTMTINVHLMLNKHDVLLFYRDNVDCVRHTVSTASRLSNVCSFRRDGSSAASCHLHGGPRDVTGRARGSSGAAEVPRYSVLYES